MVGSGRSKKTGTNRKGTQEHKRGVWEDVRKPQGVHDGKSGPLGTTDKIALDDDLPAQGKHYCTPCAKYFVSDTALATHIKTKPHKRRCKALMGAKPHNQADADWASGMGVPDNGQGTRPVGMEVH
ncbi:hypothetical protein KSW81_006737 [Nannochloris sp. 'desiccata']|nr:hypothetical protein KSW81_006737 [Chlorella desiccata (nom. nud.)]